MIPALFIGHGSPMNAIEDNEFTKSWKSMAASMPRPRAILCISAHWLKEGTAVTAMDEPKTIHDFYGFPEELYKVKYAAKGSQSNAGKISNLLDAQQDHEWGLDHGTWSVLVHMYPQADIPVLQLSLDYFKSPEEMVQMGKKLRSLRNEFLIIGSGNLVHNLMAMQIDVEPYQWAQEFSSHVRRGLHDRDDKSLIDLRKNRNASLAHPTIDHYLPLMFLLGASDERPEFFNEKIVMGSVDMTCAKFGK